MKGYNLKNIFTEYYNICTNCSEAIMQCIRYGNYEPRTYFINTSKKLAYLEIAKVGSSSIISSLLEHEQYSASNPTIIHRIGRGHVVSELDKKDGFEDYYFFSYVRNPFERVVSCYKDRIVRVNTYYRRATVHLRFLADSISFDDFVDKIALVPDRLADRHFRSQYSVLYKNGKCLVDFVEHIESSQQTYSKFTEEYGLPPLENHNRTKKDNWMDYYTLDSAQKVYRRYKNDIVKFGYMDEYKNLISYLKQKAKIAGR